MGEDMLQRWIVELLRPLLQWWLMQRGVKAFVGADQFIYWRQHDSHARVAPDLYVLPGVEPHTRVRTWKLWQDRVVPSFALEVVSQDWEKDYVEAVERYEALGVPEVLMFDPEWESHESRVCWQVFRRVGQRGLVRVEATNDDRVRSKALRCWLRVAGEGRDLRLRIAVGPRGEEIVPTAEERADTERAAKDLERAAKEQERAAKEQERAAKEQERTAKEAALARVSELEAELQRLTRRLRRH